MLQGVQPLEDDEAVVAAGGVVPFLVGHRPKICLARAFIVGYLREMDENAGSRARPLSGISLQQKLPLVMGLLILLLVLIGVLGSYLQVRQSAMDATEARVTTVDKWLRDVLGAQAANRVALLEAVGDTASALRSAVTGGARDSAAVEQSLERIRPRSDSALPVELWSAQGVRVASIGPTDLIADRAPPLETTFAEVTPRFG